MGEAHDQEGRTAHRDAAPNWGDEDVEGEQHPRSDGHDDHVVGEGPEEVETDEEVSPFQEPHQGQDLVQVL